MFEELNLQPVPSKIEEAFSVRLYFRLRFSPKLYGTHHEECPMSDVLYAENVGSWVFQSPNIFWKFGSVPSKIWWEEPKMQIYSPTFELEAVSQVL